MSTETILVTGASADIGLALLARIAARPDHRVVAHCHAGDGRLAGLRDELGARMLVVKADLADVAACEALIGEVDAAQMRPTQLVHLPALPLVYERFTKFDWTRFQRDLEIQVGSLVRLLGHWLPRPSERPPTLAKVVVVSSSVTHGAPPKYLSMYTAAKYAQLGLMRALAAEYAERGVVMNTISPSMVETQFLASVPSKIVEMSAAAHPTKRNATADEVAAVIEWLLSANSPFLNGADVPMTGGV